MGSLRIILIRHAETVENAAKLVQGHFNGSLSKLGREQASKLAQRLAKVPFNALYSSDLKRAFETASAITKVHTAENVISDIKLREQNFGIYEGGSVFSMLRAMKRQEMERDEFDPEEGETASEFKTRVHAFFNDIKLSHPGETVAVVTHSGVIRVVLDELTRSDFELKEKLSNCSVNTIELDQYADAWLKIPEGCFSV